MDLDITLKNYRCFPDERPARISARRGFTAFVGVNNSGKSSLLKFFYEFRHLFKSLSQPTGNVINALQGTLQSFDFAASVLDPAEVFSNTNSRDLEMELRTAAVDHETDGALPVPDRVVLTIPRGTNTWRAEAHVQGRPLGPEDASKIRITGTQLHLGGSPVAELSGFFQACRALSETLYIGPFRNAINVGTNESYFDISVGQAFIKQWRRYKTGNVGRENEAAYRLTEDIRHIFGFKDLEINPSDDDQTLQVFVNGKSYKLPELGSGLTQFILVLVNAAVQKPSFVLIDEPELNLHPSLQLDFLTTLTSYSRHGILFATHSVGLARASAERIYSVSKIDEGVSEVNSYEATPRLSEFLGELSFTEYQELGFNRVLLVEGPTDVKTVQQFLRQGRKDHEIILLPLGGSSVINSSTAFDQLMEIKRISRNITALIDSEKDSSGAVLSAERRAFIRACRKARVTCHVLERRAMENYLSDAAVKRIKGETYRALEPYEARKDVNPVWAKSENWRIAREMSLDDLKGTDLGRFLKSL